ncbi:MAG: hypothetical protein IKY00_00570 [Clostridia bacterium]|nr:hypothetical protein [Clostridia bacterium]
MERFIWLIIMVPCSALFTGIGIYALRCKKPMWFWAGSKVEEYEITDIPKYNRANGIMWIAFSSVFWLSAVMGLFRMEAAGIVVAVWSLAGIPALIIAYKKIYDKYRFDR